MHLLIGYLSDFWHGHCGSPLFPLASLLVLIGCRNASCSISPTTFLTWSLVLMNVCLSFSVSLSVWYFVAGRRQRWPTRVVEQLTWPQHILTQRMLAILSWAVAVALTTWKLAQKWSVRDGSRHWSWPKLKLFAWWTISLVRTADTDKDMWKIQIAGHTFYCASESCKSILHLCTVARC